MNKKQHIFLTAFLLLLIIGGLSIAATGVYWLEGNGQKTATTSRLPADHPKAKFEFIQVETTVFGVQTVVKAQSDVSEFREASAESKKGFTIGELMRGAGIAAVILAMGILLYIEFLYKHRVKQANYRLLLVICLLVLPIIVGMGTTATVLETTKTVQSCNSCHVMHPFVNDLKNPESTTLSARHYKNKWIPKYQCYTCHTTYGAHGTLASKRDGFRHWLLYVTGTWQEPITYSGTYPNSNCLACHGGTEKFATVESHQALFKKLKSDAVNCTDCHGPAHPLPGEREKATDNISEMVKPHKGVGEEKLKQLKKFVHELR